MLYTRSISLVQLRLASLNYNLYFLPTSSLSLAEKASETIAITMKSVTSDSHF